MRYFFLVLVFVFASHRAVACASCGSGSSDPLVLYPNESVKYYLGLSDQSGYRTIDTSGDLRRSNGPDHKMALTLATGLRLTQRSFTTFTLPYLLNKAGSDSQSHVGDPRVSYRYTLVPLNFSDPLIPQIQFIVGLKKSVTRSMAETEDGKMLDVFGNGSDEAKFGLDIFYWAYHR